MLFSKKHIMDSSQLKEHLNKLGKNVSYYCNKAYNKSSNLFNYLNQKFRERFSGYETILSQYFLDISTV